MNCPKCGNPGTFIQQNQQWYCYTCYDYITPEENNKKEKKEKEVSEELNEDGEPKKEASKTPVRIIYVAGGLFAFFIILGILTLLNVMPVPVTENQSVAIINLVAAQCNSSKEEILIIIQNYGTGSTKEGNSVLDVRGSTVSYEKTINQQVQAIKNETVETLTYNNIDGLKEGEEYKITITLPDAPRINTLCIAS